MFPCRYCAFCRHHTRRCGISVSRTDEVSHLSYRGRTVISQYCTLLCDQARKVSSESPEQQLRQRGAYRNSGIGEAKVGSEV